MESAGFASISEDVLQHILSKLPARSFSAASCVSRSWNKVSRRILSQPKLRSALSMNRDAQTALEEVFDEVLSEPIRPDFVIANVCGEADLEAASKFIMEKVGPTVPVVVTDATGVIGKEVRGNRFREVKTDDILDSDACVDCNCSNSAILLTIGYVPGMKIDVVPLLQPREGPTIGMVDRFVMDIRNYVRSVSDHKAPACIILFGNGDCNQEPVMEKLDYAMPAETIIVGYERAAFFYRNCSNSKDAGNFVQYTAGLVFARDRNKREGVGAIQFHAALSRGVSTVGPKLKAASVWVNDIELSTYLTARRERHPEILDGEQILNAVNHELEDRIECPNLYIGVTKRRNFSTGSEKPKPRTLLSLHEVLGGDEHYLAVDGVGIKTGDHFQFFYSDPNIALASVSNVASGLRDLRTGWSSSGHVSAFGGFIIACGGRGAQFSGQCNIDSFPFLENFPEVPLFGVFCGGEMGRGFFCGEEFQGEEDLPRQCRHVYSTLYLLMSYSPASLND